MLVTLVPFFLAANISANESDWRYGPEVIYDGIREGWTPPLDASGQSMIFNTTVKIHCRPDSENALRCYSHEPRVVVTLLKPSGESQVIVNSTKKVFGQYNKDYFDIEFSKGEWEYKLYASTTQFYETDFIKLLATQLNIAMYWTEEDESEIEEDSTLGTCKVKNNIVFKKAKSDDVVKSSPYKIVMNPELKDSTSTILTKITSTRNASSCSARFYTWKGIDMQLKSSTSHIIVTEGDFTSYTENELIFKNRRVQEDGKIARERITLSLDRIIPATGSLSQMSRECLRNQRVFRLFNSGTFQCLIKKQQKQFDVWLNAARKKTIAR